MEQRSIAPADLLLDPNNYRFQELDNYVEAADERFAEDSVRRKHINACVTKKAFKN